MTDFIKDTIVIVLLAIFFTVATVLLYRLNFRFISGVVCFPALLFYFAIYGIGHDMYGEYKDKRDRARRDEKWRKEQFIRDMMES
jgi:hypothetical protein